MKFLHLTLSKVKPPVWAVLLLLSLLFGSARLIANFLDGNYIRLVYEFTAGTCFFLLPTAVFAKRLRLYGWLLYPLVLGVTISLFCVALYHMPFNYDIMVVIYNTNFDEAFEFAKGYIWIFILAVVIYLFAYYYLVSWLPKEVDHKSALAISVLALMGFVSSSWMYNHDEDKVQALKSAFSSSYPGSAIFSITTFQKHLAFVKGHEHELESFKFHSKQASTIASKQIYVLVIGESSRVENWQIFGYNRATTPYMAKRGEHVIRYPNMTSGGYVTTISVPILLTRATPDNYTLHYSEKSVVAAFKEAGFKTYWLSNQNDFNDVGIHAAEADQIYYLPATFTLVKGKHYDMDLLPFFEKILSKNEQKIFVVLHTMGSHYDYKDRYPNEFDFFKPSLKTHQVNPTDFSGKRYMLNSYDNSIMYTDAFLERVMSMVEDKKAVSTVTYVADHGEDMFDDDRKWSQHIQQVPSKYIAKIPLLMSTSLRYDQQFPEKLKYLKKHQGSAVAATNIFYTLLDLADVKYPKMDASQSIANKFFIDGKQRMMGGRGIVYNVSDLK